MYATIVKLAEQNMLPQQTPINITFHHQGETVRRNKQVLVE
jgi:hypothetical protein